MKKKILLLPILFIFINTFSQNYTINGIISDSLSSESIINAVVSIENTKKYSVANEYGFYSITANKGEVLLTTRIIGYKSKQIKFNLNKDTVLDIYLQKKDVEINEVVVTGNNKYQSNTYNLDITKAKRIPVLLGEKDLMKSLLLSPGISTGSEGSSNLYVRGGSADQNLILLDNVPVYNANHLFGFLSVFNPDALKSVKIIKGGIPARYNGRASSVVDIHMKEGDLKQFHSNISVGLLASKFTIESPIIKNKSSFILSARRTYLDLLFLPISKKVADNTLTGYYFWDINFKINSKINDKNRIFFSLYTGKDKGFVKLKEEKKENQIYNYSKGEQNLRWGNLTSSLRWFSIISPKISLNTALIYSKFKFQTINDYHKLTIYEQTDTSEQKYYYENSSGIQDIALKTNADFYLNNSNHIKIGGKIIYHEFYPSFTSEAFSDNYSEFNIEKTTSQNNIYATEFSTYLEDEIKFKSWFRTNLGVNFNGFFVDNNLYKSLEPRILFDFRITKKINVQTSYSKITQYIHLLTNSSVSMPTDLWVPATGKIKPIKSDIYDFGIVFNNNKFLLSSSIFYKTGQNFIKYLPGINILEIETDWQEKVATGKGYSYGLELMLEKKYGKLTGWISYTYSRSFRTFENINFGKEFPFKYDRPHNLNIVVFYNFNKNISLAGNFILMSGYNTTFAEQHFFTSNLIGINSSLDHYSTINNLRTPIYHRADISINFAKQKKRGRRIWSVGIYNFYNRLNPYVLETTDDSLLGICIFPIIPSISYSFKF